MANPILSASTSGTMSVQLAKARAESFPHVACIQGNSTPKFDGDMATFHQQNEAIQHQLVNKVRKCKNCGKPNAFTLEHCNSCATSLEGIDITFTHNVFMGFIYGVAKAPFPLTISLRYQSENVIVWDDLLALCPVHLNAIPADTYIPDMRYLLRDPARGLKVVESLLDALKIGTKTFLADKQFMAKTFKNGETKSEEEMLSCAIVGFNYPPSQYQLHVQWLLPPLIPTQHYNYMKGLHFTQGRFIPMEYVLEILKTNDSGPKFSPDLPIEAIFEHYNKEHKIDYTKIFEKMYAKVATDQEKLANWKVEDFEAVVVDNKEAINIATGEPEKASIGDMQNSDKMAIQNYGRPYADGKPKGWFYKYPKEVGSVMDTTK